MQTPALRNHGEARWPLALRQILLFRAASIQSYRVNAPPVARERGTYRQRVVFCRQFPIYQVAASVRRCPGGDDMAIALNLSGTSAQVRGRLHAATQAFTEMAAEYALAVSAAAKAESPRQRLPELRAMYLPSQFSNK
jgi:hypothetical protein